MKIINNGETYSIVGLTFEEIQALDYALARNKELVNESARNIDGNPNYTLSKDAINSRKLRNDFFEECTRVFGDYYE